jgi:flagellar assembly factor FliW
MQLTTRHFGTIEIDEAKIIHFPKGLIGFPEAKRFSLLLKQEVKPYQWLQCVDQPELTFLVIPVVLIRPDYDLRISDAEPQELKLVDENGVVTLAIVTVPDDPNLASVNLLAPLVINEPEWLGGQILNENRDYSTRHVIREELNKYAREGKSDAGAHQEKETVGDAR